MFRKRPSSDSDLTMPTWFRESELLFLSSKQILYSLDQERKEVSPSGSKLSIGLDNRLSAFEQILGINTVQPPEVMKPKLLSSTSTSFPPASANTALNQLLTTPAHVLPPMNILCSQYLTSLLPPALLDRLEMLCMSLWDNSVVAALPILSKQKVRVEGAHLNRKYQVLLWSKRTKWHLRSPKWIHQQKTPAPKMNRHLIGSEIVLKTC